MTPQKTILIVDDEDQLRRSLSLILQKEMYGVETVANAEEALDRLKSGDPAVLRLERRGELTYLAFIVD